MLTTFVWASGPTSSGGVQGAAGSSELSAVAQASACAHAHHHAGLARPCVLCDLQCARPAQGHQPGGGIWSLRHVSLLCLRLFVPPGAALHSSLCAGPTADSRIQFILRSQAAAALLCAVPVVTLLLPTALQVYARNFEVQDVQLHMLVNMGHQDLIGFGISSFGHRESILQGIKEFLTAYLRAVEASRNSEL